jgi:hypothetical protein
LKTILNANGGTPLGGERYQMLQTGKWAQKNDGKNKLYRGFTRMSADKSKSLNH